MLVKLSFKIQKGMDTNSKIIVGMSPGVHGRPTMFKDRNIDNTSRNQLQIIISKISEMVRYIPCSLLGF